MLISSVSRGSELFFSKFISMFSTGNIWNTIAFTKPTYITFPTFRPETTVDISFHFKTYRDHCVFLENSDDHLRNFIRIELNSEWVHLLEGNSQVYPIRTVHFVKSILLIVYFLFLQPPRILLLYLWLAMASLMRPYTLLCHLMTTSGISFRPSLT